MLNDFLLWLLDTIQALDPVLRTTIAGVAMMLETSALVGLVVPGDAVVLLAATGVTTFWGGVVLFVVVVVGALIGESIGYALGRWFGPALQRSRVGQLLGDQQWERAQRYIQRRGGLAIFLSRFVPVLHSTVPMVAGMTRFRYRTFLAWTIPACVIWAAAYVTVGSLAANAMREYAGSLHIAGYIFVAVILLFVCGVWAVKRFILRSEKRHLEPPATATPTPTQGADDSSPHAASIDRA
ncbi:DedA family protein [Leucobacter weissii]|uniref:DedA family protein n=1 Tax=Leucobacter weissii TaxID=1983706 RepID=A0A939SCL2_9MICO|nr:DedA family protein [Leucobacter weissii]MBO1902473.1 DedA family protein [Leucobacter weissii]